MTKNFWFWLVGIVMTIIIVFIILDVAGLLEGSFLAAYSIFSLVAFILLFALMVVLIAFAIKNMIKKK